MRREEWPDWMVLYLAGWLFIAPWVLEFRETAAAPAWNAWVAGLLVGLSALAALARFARWQQWINLGLGSWLVLSALLLGGAAAASVNAVAVGSGVATLSALNLAGRGRQAR